MSHRHSCDRCRQQKVRCLRDESHGSNPTSPGRAALSRCERCTKADVDCVYSLKQRYSRPSGQPSARRDNNADPTNLNGTSWFGQGLGGVFCMGAGGTGPDLADLAGLFPGVDDRGAIAGFKGRDANLHLLSPISPLNPSAAPSGAISPAMGQEASDALDQELSEGQDWTETGADPVGPHGDMRAVSTGPSTINDGEDDEDPADAYSSELMALSQRATRAVRRLARPGYAPPNVSSPEVNEAFDHTNTLIRIINNINAASADRDDITVDPTTTDYGLVFMALASHQHLVALFRAICDAIHRCLLSMALGNEHQQQRPRSLHQGGAGPSSVAQFVMVLQLLMHLINRMDRSLFQVDQSGAYGSLSSTGGQVTPARSNTGQQDTIHPLLIEAGFKSNASSGLPAPGGLPALAQTILSAIPDEHEKLRQGIQELQTKMEHS